MLSLVFLALLSDLGGQTPSKFIHIDQFGYLPNAVKVAVISDPQIGFNAGDNYTAPATLELVNAITGITVWSGSPQLWNGGATDSQSGDRGWWLDFSAWTSAGEYYLQDPNGTERSATFTISDQVYDDLMADAGRAFFYNRCNAPKAAPFAEPNWTDGTNFLNPLQDGDCSALSDPENASMRRDLSGGWFDAGDYNKYVTFAYSAVNPLLWAYAESPAAFTDSWNIPESGNGIPDLLDELKWELDWLLKMTNPDGSVIIKMGSIDYNDNAAAPPSANTDRRYYGPTCTSASIAAAAMFAQAADVMGELGSLSSYAQTLRNQAVSTFDYWLSRQAAGTLEFNCDDGTIKSGDADWNEDNQWKAAQVAAIHLFALTGDAAYNSFLIDHQDKTAPLATNFWGVEDNVLNTALMYYTTVPGADASLSTRIINGLTTEATNNWNGYFGMGTNDLYRAFIPDWSYHWGSSNSRSRYGSLNNLVANYDLISGQAASFRAKSAGILHSFHGLNPLGIVYLSGMEGRGAERGIQEIYHTWFNEGTIWDNSATSPNGPAPGFVSGGPNKDFSLNFISPPAGQPMGKAYKDWNTGWNGSYNENSWEISEPAIYYQAAYIRNLAAQMTNSLVLPVVYASPLQGRARTKDILLSWRVELEENASHYEVEYLEVNNHWSTIGRAAASNRDLYQFVHPDPIDGPNSYRLKQVDVDGSFSYSNVATVMFRDLYAQIDLFPNPAAEQLQLTNLPSTGELCLYDSQGRELSRHAISSGNLELNLLDLSEGWYSIELIQAGEGRVWASRFLKQ